MSNKRLRGRGGQTIEDRELSNVIDALNSSYHYHKHVLFEDEYGVTHYECNRLWHSRRSVMKIESTLEMLPEKERLIIEAEVINSKKGTKWYREFFSTPSYYRNRKAAYKMFIDLINK